MLQGENFWRWKHKSRDKVFIPSAAWGNFLFSLREKKTACKSFARAWKLALFSSLFLALSRKRGNWKWKEKKVFTQQRIHIIIRRSVKAGEEKKSRSFSGLLFFGCFLSPSENWFFLLEREKKAVHKYSAALPLRIHEKQFPFVSSPLLPLRINIEWNVKRYKKKWEEEKINKKEKVSVIWLTK